MHQLEEAHRAKPELPSVFESNPSAMPNANAPKPDESVLEFDGLEGAGLEGAGLEPTASHGGESNVPKPGKLCAKPNPLYVPEPNTGGGNVNGGNGGG